jgi:hypothetical protein
MQAYSLLNAADDGLALYIPASVFDESLLLNVLFQQQVAIYDSFLFDSTHLAAHFERAKGEPCLFELAARDGLIVPAFRDSSTQSVEHARDIAKDAYGPGYELCIPEMKPFEARIISSVDAGIKKSKPLYWPNEDEAGETLAERFQGVVTELLQTDAPPVYAQYDSTRQLNLESVWEQTNTWRHNCILEAVDRTKEKGKKGLQRVELLRVVSQSLNIAGDGDSIVTERKLLTSVDDQILAHALELYWKWIIQCQHLAWAKSFGIALNFPVYNLDRDFILDSILPSPLDAKTDDTMAISCSVQLPAIDILLKTPTSELIRIRQDLGHAYLWTLERWQDNPIKYSDDLQCELRRYCNAICERYQRAEIMPFLAHFNSTSGSSMAKSIRAATFATADKLLPNFAIGFFVTIAKSAVAVYQYVRGRKSSQKLATTERELELTLPEDGFS